VDPVAPAQLHPRRAASSRSGSSASIARRNGAIEPFRWPMRYWRMRSHSWRS